MFKRKGGGVNCVKKTARLVEKDIPSWAHRCSLHQSADNVFFSLYKAMFLFGKAVFVDHMTEIQILPGGGTKSGLRYFQVL